MSASMGISIYPDNATDIDTLIQQADAAMYKAKQAGRSTYRFFSADMNRLAEQRLAYSAALRSAIANDGLKLHLSAADPHHRRRHPWRRGAGALARSRCSARSRRRNSSRWPKKCGLIEQIGLWSIREACRQMAAVAPGRAGHPLRVGQSVADQFPEREPGRGGRRDPRGPWPAAGSADARDHRRRDPERALGRDRDHECDSQARRRPVAGRFRNRLFEPQPAGASADPRIEDRPQLHARRRAATPARARSSPPWSASARACNSPSSPRASKPTGSASCWPSSAATSCRDFSTRPRCRRERSSDGCSTMSPSRPARCARASRPPARNRRRQADCVYRRLAAAVAS